MQGRDALLRVRHDETPTRTRGTASLPNLPDIVQSLEALTGLVASPQLLIRAANQPEIAKRAGFVARRRWEKPLSHRVVDRIGHELNDTSRVLIDGNHLLSEPAALRAIEKASGLHWKFQQILGSKRIQQRLEHLAF